MQLTDFNGRDVLVLGAGVSGQAAALLLRSAGANVTIADESPDMHALAERLAEVIAAGCKFVSAPSMLPAQDFKLCVVSPAFAPSHPWLEQCRFRGIQIISELQLGAQFCSADILAVTGSKGKSSIVKLCSDAFNACGVSASPAGNYGIPLCELNLKKTSLEWAVTEVSSFQMESTASFAPRIAILLNLQPDHLDRHSSMAEYKTLKMRMFAAMKPDSLALIHEDIELDRPLPNGVRLMRFGVRRESEWQWRAGAITGKLNGRNYSVNLTESWFDNSVFGISAAAAVAALAEAGLSAECIAAALRDFVPLPHRMERFFQSATGVSFVDDSKATSLSAMSAAVKMIKGPVYLIAGGLLKEKLSENPQELLASNVKKVYLIGNCCEQMLEAWSESVTCVKCHTLETAVRMAVNDSKTGSTVLLSPGTASFDQFKSYKERGERFKSFVRAFAGQS